MRGIAVLAAAMAGWVAGRGAVPRVRLRALPHVEAKAALVAAVGGLATAVLTLGLTETPVVAAAAGTLGATVPFWRAAAATARRRAAVADAWPDLLAVLRSHLASGRSLPEAFIAAAHRSVPALAAAAQRIEDRLAGGASFAGCLAGLRADLDDAIADRVLATLEAAQQSGGPRVAAILAALGSSVADELRLRKAHDAALTQQRLTAAVALVAPWGLLLLTVATNPQAAAVYRTPSGTAIVLGGLGATGAGYLLARRTARLSRPPRLFRGGTS